MKKTERNGMQVMLGLIGMVKPLIGMMCVAILMGCIGNLMASFLTILGGYGLLTAAGMEMGMSWSMILFLLVFFALFRGILRYAEQAGNHYIAFKLLARIRHKVFRALRRLAPAKLEGAEKGNLISIITSDIELLEVFYAHTISPIAIAVITSVFMVFFIGSRHVFLGGIAAVFYVLVGVCIPLYNGKSGAGDGQRYRKVFGSLNTTVLDNLYGLEEILQYGRKNQRLETMQEKTTILEQTGENLKRKEALQKILTDSAILAAGALVTAVSGILIQKGTITFADGMIAVIAVMSSFGPVAALSALSNNLHHTLASGNRVLDLLEEEPITKELPEGAEEWSGGISCSQVTFGYPESERKVLQHFQAEFVPGKVYGIFGKSGCGKSTLLKLFMRFYETEDGTIRYGQEDINQIQTAALRKHISYVTQETFLFHDTVENNIKIAKADATREEVIAAAEKASVHEWIESLPGGYETVIAELGSSVSGGEKQRIGLARAFLHDSDLIFLDEPTSNIDSLNEGMILKSLERVREGKTVLLVSHRRSTMGIADKMIAM